MSDYVGTNTTAPGVYDVAREKAGPDAHRLVTNDVWVDFTAKYLNRDVLKAGNPGDSSFITNARASKIHGYDAGRAFMSACCNDGVTVEDFVAENVAHSMLNCEPEGATKGVTNVVMRRGAVGNVGYFALGSKGYNLPVSVLLEDVQQIPGTTVGNVVWIGTPNNDRRRVATLRRCSFVTRRQITDTLHATDPYGVKVDVVGKAAFPIFSIDVDLTLEDVWVDGKPVTLSDIQWQWVDSKGGARGVQPVIKHTPGWNPSMIAPPVGVRGYTPPVVTPPVVVPPPVVEPPPPPPQPVDELARLQFLLELNEAAQGELQAKIDKAREALA